MNLNNFGMLYTGTVNTGTVTTTVNNSAVSGQYITTTGVAVTSVTNGKLYIDLEFDPVTLAVVASGSPYFSAGLTSAGAISSINLTCGSTVSAIFEV